MQAAWRNTPTGRGRGGRLLAAALVAGLSVPLAVPAAADPAVTTQQAQDFSVRPLPCAPDTGYFAITVTYNETWRTSGDGQHEHSTRTGTFEAVPVEVTRFDDVADDDHDHPVPVEWRARAGSEYVGRITATASFNANRATTATFRVGVQGFGTDGERFSLHYLSHTTETPRGTVPAAFEKGRCGN